MTEQQQEPACEWCRRGSGHVATDHPLPPEHPDYDAFYERLERRQMAGYERTLEFVLTAVREERREPRADWRVALDDLAQDLDRIVRRDAHPDDVAYARLAMGALAGVWLSVEEAEGLYLADTPQDTPEGQA